jgi:hypothetical protein
VDGVVEEELDLRMSALKPPSNVQQDTHVFETLCGLEVLGLIPVPLAEARKGPADVRQHE